MTTSNNAVQLPQAFHYCLFAEGITANNTTFFYEEMEEFFNDNDDKELLDDPDYLEYKKLWNKGLLSIDSIEVDNDLDRSFLVEEDVEREATGFVVTMKVRSEARLHVTGTFEEVQHEQLLSPVHAHMAVLEGAEDGTETFIDLYREWRTDWRETATEAAVDFEDLQLRIAELALEYGEIRITSVELVGIVTEEGSDEVVRYVQNLHYELGV